MQIHKCTLIVHFNISECFDAAETAVRKDVLECIPCRPRRPRGMFKMIKILMRRMNKIKIIKTGTCVLYSHTLILLWIVLFIIYCHVKHNLTSSNWNTITHCHILDGNREQKVVVCGRGGCWYIIWDHMLWYPGAWYIMHRQLPDILK